MAQIVGITIIVYNIINHIQWYYYTMKHLSCFLYVILENVFTKIVVVVIAIIKQAVQKQKNGFEINGSILFANILYNYSNYNYAECMLASNPTTFTGKFSCKILNKMVHCLHFRAILP